MRGMQALGLMIVALGVVIPSHKSMATQAPDYQCVTDPHPDLAPNGYYVGELLYRLGDSLGLTARPQDDREVLFRVETDAGETYSNGVVRFDADDSGARLTVSDGTSFPCEVYVQRPLTYFVAANQCMAELGVIEPETTIGVQTDSLEQILARLDAFMTDESERAEFEEMKSVVRGCAEEKRQKSVGD